MTLFNNAVNVSYNYEDELNLIFEPINSPKSKQNCYKLYQYLNSDAPHVNLEPNTKAYIDINQQIEPVAAPEEQQVRIVGTSEPHLLLTKLGFTLETYPTLCDLHKDNISTLKSTANTARNITSLAKQIHSAKLKSALKNADCNFLYIFIDIYKKSRIFPAFESFNHKNVLIIDKVNKKIIHFEPKSNGYLKTIAEKTRNPMNKDVIMTQLGSTDELKSLLNPYSFIAVNGSQPTNMGLSSLYCVIYSVYAVILFIINYDRLCSRVSLTSESHNEAGPTGPSSFKSFFLSLGTRLKRTSTKLSTKGSTNVSIKGRKGSTKLSTKGSTNGGGRINSKKNKIRKFKH